MDNRTAASTSAGPSAAPTVSAIVPAYNEEQRIARALASVYAQTYPGPIEVVVVDDGSTDGTARLVSDLFPDAVLVQQPNAGLSAARNSGIRAASGEYVGFLDADDEWLPDKVARQMAILMADQSVDFCGCLQEVETSYGRRIRGAPERPGGLVKVEFAPYLARESQPLRCLPIGRKDDLLSLGGFDESLRRFEDRELWLRVLAAGHSVVVLQEYLYRWCLQRESLSQGRRGLSMHEAALDILARWDPECVPLARGLIAPEVHAQAKRRALRAASLSHARYAEYQKARAYAAQALAIAGGSSIDRGLLGCVGQAPVVYGACARTSARIRRFVRRLLPR